QSGQLVVHRNDDLGLELVGHGSRLRRRQSVAAAYRDEKDVDGTQPGQLLLGKAVAQVTQMCHHDVIDRDRVEGHPAQPHALRVIVVGSDALDVDPAYLVLAGPVDEVRVTAHHGQIVVTEMVVADGDNVRGEAARHLGRQTKPLAKRVGDDARVPPPDLEAAVTQIANFHFAGSSL